MISLNEVFIAVIGFLLLYIFVIAFRGKKIAQSLEQQKIPLSELAGIWAQSKRTGPDSYQ